MAAHLISKANKNTETNTTKVTVNVAIATAQCLHGTVCCTFSQLHFVRFDSSMFRGETEKKISSNQCDNNAYVCIIDKTHSTPM